MVLIRKYNSSDLEAVTDLMADLGYPTDVDSMKQRMKLIENNPGYFTFVATIQDHEVVGMIGTRLVHYYEGDGVTVQISIVVVREDLQGKEIGKELLAFIENWAKEKGANSLYLSSGIKPERIKAHEFYKKNGFDINGYRFVKRFEMVQ
ncbi:GNAT family N-acetyltransferase [Paenibacillus woosongensis]|uniref:GNAT family N-acetyltransferase n=1 Tax=Paenibacillus woosongensis TaxID=307580 RepID=A0A7X2YXI7_9BACL|nr:GNAT family N-acetyltransferase [Paenibacillus woosongensis]MUG43563.1 GNAT family N-acetyltransferase [Paenibacillus woosongensis]